MRPLFRFLHIGVLALSASHLAAPGAAGTELEWSAAAWAIEPIIEPSGPPAFDPAEAAVLIAEPPGTDIPTVADGDLQPELLTGRPDSSPSGQVEQAQRPSASAATALVGEASRESSYQIHQNEQVLRFLEQFQTGYRRAVVERWLIRSGRYLPMILEVFRQKGLPEELVFTAMIESGFNPVAVSHAGAKGLWQLMAPTARRYGLRVDRWLDERLDPEKSTVAAASYLSDLYKMFGSWDLATAAYNAGEMKVLRAIQGTGTRDFWSLTRTRLLKDETKNFVPAIHAVTIIGQEPEQYGFTVKPEEPLSYEQITVPKGTNLTYVSTLSGISLEELVRLNSELRLKQTPPDAPYRLKVPLGSAAALQVSLDRDAEARKAAPPVRTADRGKPRVQVAQKTGKTPAGIHVVQPHETIGSIAKRYGVSVQQLTRWNDLQRGVRIFPGDRLRVASALSETGQGGFR